MSFEPTAGSVPATSAPRVKGSGDGVRTGFTGDVWIVPGFVDLHCHLAIDDQGAGDIELMRRNAEAEIRAGVLAIRQPGTPVPVPRQALPHDRPIVIDAGQHIARPRRYIRGIGIEIEAANGSENTAENGADRASLEQLLAQEVQNQARVAQSAHAQRGTEQVPWVKLVGDWIDRSKGSRSDLDPLWTASQINAAVQSAHTVGAKVCVHTFSHGAIDDLITAHVDSIEHGSGMNRAQMDAAALVGIPVVPTTSQVLKFPEFARAAQGKYPVYAATMAGMYERRLEWFSDLLASGVTLLPGSDAGGYQPHGSVIQEIQRWVKWGMNPEQALAAATWEARDFLGLQSLSQGAPADFVVFSSNPDADATVWSKPTQVVANGAPVL